MDLALQPVRRNLRAKPVPLNLSICALRTFGDPAPSLFLRIARQYRYRRPASTALTPAMQSAPPLSTFRINTSKSVSKQRTLTTFRMNTCEKGGEGGCSPSLRTVLPPVICFTWRLHPPWPQWIAHTSRHHGVWGATVLDRSRNSGTQ